MMTQAATCFALQPLDDEELIQHLEVQASSDAPPSDRAAAESAEALLPAEDVDAAAPFKFNDAVLAGFRIGYRQDAAQTAQKTLAAGAAATQTILQMAGWIQEMKTRLSRKEFGAFVKDLLQWAGGEARKYLDIARAFDGFDLSRLQGVEPFTLLKLRSKRYSEVIARLRESALITQQLVQELISQLIPKPQRKKRASQEHLENSGRADAVITRHADAASGTFYYTLKAVNLSEEIGSKLEDLLESQTIGQILAQAASGPQPNEYYRAQLKELKDVVDNARELERELHQRDLTIAQRDRLIAELEAKLASGVVPLVVEADGEPTLEATVALPELNEPQQQLLVIADDTATPAYALDNITESYPESCYANDSKEPQEPADDPEPEPTSESLELELTGDARDLSPYGHRLVEQPESPFGLKIGDLVQINATSDRTWNGLSGYIQKLSPDTGKATVLLQGDYRSKHFFLNELKLVHQGVQPQEPVEETNPDAIAQSPEAAELVESGSTTTVPNAVAQEQVQPASHPQLSDGASTALQPLVADWDVLRQLRDAEGCLRKIDTLIQDLNSQLAQSSSNVVERELRPVLKKQQHLRSTTVDQIVALIDSNVIPAYYEEQQNKGRVVLDRKYASTLLHQAQSWSDVVMVVGGNTKQLLATVKPWSFDEKQHLVRLLSTYLETEPLALENIDWIPKNLLEKSLSSLSFRLRKIGGANNLVDEPKIEYIPCDFVSLEYPGTRSEQWIFRGSDNKIYPVFGRDEIEVERF